MKRVLVLGTGYVVKPLVDYFIDKCNLDFNNDTIINIIDVVNMIIYIIDPPINSDNNCFDINNDFEVNILDVVSLVDYIFAN